MYHICCMLLDAAVAAWMVMRICQYSSKRCRKPSVHAAVIAKNIPVIASRYCWVIVIHLDIDDECNTNIGDGFSLIDLYGYVATKLLLSSMVAI